MKPVENPENKTDLKKKALTPDELVHRHMQNPDEPITDEDINNLVLDIDSTVIDVEKEKDIIQTPMKF